VSSDGRQSDPTPLSASLDSVLRALKRPGVQASTGLYANWEAAVGSQIAAHARPVSLVDGRLLVEVDQPGWATQLRYLEADLIERLRPVISGADLTSIELRVARSR
jgi:predicted nucleic acid-binding Zn ribbon protein